MKRFFLVTILILIISTASFFAAQLFLKPIDKGGYQEFRNTDLSSDAYYETEWVSDFKSDNQTALYMAFGVFALLMSANVLYELYIVPKKKKHNNV